MSGLSSALADYLAVRRAMGHKMQTASCYLDGFVAYCDSVGVTTITTEVALAWARLPEGTTRYYWANRLSAVRCFTRWMVAFEPRTEVPPPGVYGPGGGRRAIPYPYSEADITTLMNAAARLGPPLAQATHRTLIGLLAATGMRVGEALRLDRSDLDWRDATMRIVDSKFGKSRLLMLHPTTVAALRAYSRHRDRLCPNPEVPAFLLNNSGGRLSYSTANHTFHQLVRLADLPAHTNSAQPRMHGLRHAFAVATLIGWYRAGADVEAQLPVLSTYMGHSNPRHTYWYLSAVPELLGLAAGRLHGTWGPRS